uniref:MATA-HMG n=1 Tax=Rhizophagus irregularis TaxID=588596 RepID=A0A1B1ETW9_9GLOM|nr:MATA-HMG [Rhizophagus irregularis]ANQ32262.1 MATA-HMG [Rhizophagus irregularis]ANQ32263.1 MATA-HMG [Rhizophagus irregularis]
MQKFQSYWQKCGEMKQRKKNYIGKKLRIEKKWNMCKHILDMFIVSKTWKT